MEPRRQFAALDSLATIVQFRRGEEIYARDGPVDHWYRVTSGTARKSTLERNGVRRIVDFMLPKDYFGFSGRAVRNVDVEAVVDGTAVACYPRKRVEKLAEDDPEVGRYVRELAFESISRLQIRLLILGRGNAREKLRAFLIEMQGRTGTAGAAPFTLAMSRYDIADYLGISVETVSSCKRRSGFDTSPRPLLPSSYRAGAVPAPGIAPFVDWEYNPPSLGPSMEDIMPKWLIAALSWGGAAVAILSAAALIVVRIMASSAAPVRFYWYALFVGVVAAGIGFLLGRRKT